MAGDEEIDFASWREEFRRALERGESTSVPCAGCTACCRSGQFVHIEPDEADTLAHIDPALLFPAPGRPPGHLVMGYDAEGRCPMLGLDGCRIYEHRPRTCRIYDCRVFAATGIRPDQPLVAEAVERWRFTESEDQRLLALRASELRNTGSGSIQAAIQSVCPPDAHSRGEG